MYYKQIHTSTCTHEINVLAHMNPANPINYYYYTCTYHSS